MGPDQDTLIVTAYVVVDDIWKERFAAAKGVRRGPKPEVSDSEVLTLALLGQWYKRPSERRFLRYAGRRWGSYFPRLPSQSSFNRRVRELGGALAALGPEVGRQVGELAGAAPAYEAVDATAVPLMRRCRGKRSRLFGEAASFGRGGADRDWYYGVKLLCAVDQSGVVSGFAACRADTEERWLAEAALRWRALPGAPQPTAVELAAVLGPAHRHGGARKGPQAPVWPEEGAGQKSTGLFYADLGYAGRAWRNHWREAYGAEVVTPEGLSPEAARRLSSLRQSVERVFSILFRHFGLAFPGARTLRGLVARVSAKIAAFNTAVLFNLLHNRPAHAILDPLE
jgi:hypothetical protein